MIRSEGGNRAEQADLARTATRPARSNGIAPDGFGNLADVAAMAA
jgi:hypothetical protein